MLSRLSKISQKVTPWLGDYVLPMGVALLFLLLWTKSQSVSLAEHNQYVSTLRQLQEQDARMNQGLLQLRLGLLNNYDSIVDRQARIRTLNERLASPPSFIGRNRQQLQRQVAESQRLWQTKSALIQQFNSRHSVLRNSLAYFPITVEDLSANPATAPELVTRLNTLLQDVLLFNLSTTDGTISRIQQDITQINSLAGPENADIASSLAHANIILEKRLETDELIENALSIPTRQQGRSLVESYDMAYQQAVRTANLYRFGLYFFLTGLVIAIATAIISKLRTAAIAQQQSENTQQALFQAIPDLMLRMHKSSPMYEVVSSGQNVPLLNPPLKSADLNSILPQEIVSKRMAAVDEALSTRTTQVYEQHIVAADRVAWEEVRVVPCGKQDVLVMIRDISDRKQSEENLQRATQEAQVANKAKSQFLSNMSHELRTPLNVILGFTQLMTRNGALDLQQQGYLESINQSGEHLLSLINDVLEMSKIEAGKVSLTPHDFDLHGLLVGIHTMFQFKANSQGLELTLQKANNLPQYVHADESKLRQVLVNLVGNAVKFTQAGRIQLRAQVATSTAPSGEHASANQQDSLTLAFEVEDTGPGISVEDRDVLFDPFIQAKRQLSHPEGTGLGLPISRKFVEIMGGELSLSSQIGVGSQFSFSVKVEPAKERGTPSRSKANRTVIGLAASQPVRRILVAEDMPKNRQILVDLLSPIGFEIQEACDGLQAVTLCQAWQPDLIWMDLRMPVMDGYEAVRQIRANKTYSQPAIIALTGSAFTSERRLAIAAG
ncbi:MAG: DAHL domain-containing protein [Phormidesmis sp.]